MARIDLTGRPICITGASSGIGAATARACAAAGMPVLLAARREDKLHSVAEDIRRAGGRAEVTVCDVVEPDQCEAMVARCVEAFGGMYSVFANAGVGLERPVADMLDTTPGDTDDDHRWIFEVNYWGTVNTLRPALRRFREARAGHALICSSSIGRFTVPRHGAYCATKAAQLHLGHALRMELRGSGVHVSTVHPIGTRTEFFDQMHTRSGTDTGAIVANTPSMFMQPPSRVARAVVNALRRPRSEVWTSTTTRLAAALFTLAPGVADRLVGGAMKPKR